MTNGTSVRLERGDNWNAIPPNLQRRIEAGVQRIRSVRDSIAAAAQVMPMPSITVHPVVWTPNGVGIVQAASSLWPSTSGEREIAVRMGAGPAICTDESIVRRLLLHEFAHCFFIATEIANHLELGTPINLRGNPLDEDRDRATLANPSEWYGRADATAIIGWSDSALSDAVAEELFALVEAGHLQAIEPPPGTRGRIPDVPPEWVAHIRSLRERT